MPYFSWLYVFKIVDIEYYTNASLNQILIKIAAIQGIESNII